MKCKNINIYNLPVKEDTSDHGDILVSIESLLLCQDKLHSVLLAPSPTSSVQVAEKNNQPTKNPFGYNSIFNSFISARLEQNKYHRGRQFNKI